MAADRELLYALLALQNNFVSREDLLAALNVWVLDKSRSIADLLTEANKLRPSVRMVLDALVVEHLQQHDNSPEKSLAALSSIGSARRQLEKVPDEDLQQSLAHVSKTVADGGFDPAAETLPNEGRTVDAQRFQILRRHAKGGLGEVFLASDAEIPRHVALKRIKVENADREEYRERFLREAEITGQLEHPGIVPVYGLGTYGDGRPYYAMRFIRGHSLKSAIAEFHKDRTARTAITGERMVQFRQLLGRFIDVCQAMQYAHSREVLHRDLKPDNIMLGKYGETLIVDWGLAKTVDAPEDTSTESVDRPLRVSSSGSSDTMAGRPLGTPAYMSPEQAAGKHDQLGPATDVYALGGTLYALLTGRPPYSSAELTDDYSAVKAGKYSPPRQVWNRIPAPLASIVAKAMAVKPQNRYASAQALADDVERWLADEPVESHRENLRERIGRWQRRHRPLVRAAALLLVGATILMAIGFQHSRRQRQITQKSYDAARDSLGLLNEALAEPFPNFEYSMDDRLQTARRLNDRFEEWRLKYGHREELQPEVVRSLMWQGNLQAEAGQNAKALQYFKEAYELSKTLTEETPDQFARLYADAPVRAAYTMFKTGATQKSLELFDEAIARAKELGSQGNMAAARAHLYKADSLNELGEWAVAEGHADQSVTLLKLLNHTLPDSNELADAYCALGKSQIRQGEFDKALKSLDRVALPMLVEQVAATEQSGQIRNLIQGNVYSLAALIPQGKYQESLRRLAAESSLRTRLNQLDPTHTDHAQWLRLQATKAFVLAEGRDPDGGLQQVWDFRPLALVLDDADTLHAIAYFNLIIGRLLIESPALGGDIRSQQVAGDHLSRAIEMYSTLMNGDTSSPHAFDVAIAESNRARWLHYQGRSEEAEQEFRQAIKRMQPKPLGPLYDDTLATMHALLGELLFEDERPDEAQEEWNAALKIRRTLAGKSDLYAYRLAELLLFMEGQENHREALKVLDKICRAPADEDRPFYEAHYAFALYRTGDMATARRTLEGIDLSKPNVDKDLYEIVDFLVTADGKVESEAFAALEKEIVERTPHRRNLHRFLKSVRASLPNPES